MKKTRLNLINRKLDKIQENLNLKNRSSSLSAYVLSNEHDISMKEAIEYSTDGFDDFGIDAIFIDNSKIFIYQFKAFDQKIKSISQTEIDKINSYVELLTSNRSLNFGNERLLERSIEIRQKLQEMSPITFEICLCSNGDPLSMVAKKHLENLFSSKMCFTREITLTDLENYLYKINTEGENISFVLKCDDILEQEGTTISGAAFKIRADIFLDSITNEGHLKNIFDSNIRLSLLDSSNSINKKIIESGETEPELFWHYNNGITFICNNIDYNRLPGGGQTNFQMTNARIINGTQTTHALYEIYKSEIKRSQLEKINLLIKCTATRSEKISYNISIYSNTQNRINPMDMKSNDKTQIRIEEGLKVEGISYKRKRGQKIENKNYIDPRALGQLLLAYNLELPEISKRASEKIFTELYDKVFSEKNTNISNILEVYKISKEIEKIERASKNNGSNTADFCIYGKYYIVYAIKLLKKKSPAINLNDLVFEALNVIKDVFESEKESLIKKVSLYSFFRDSKNKEKIHDRILTLFTDEGSHLRLPTDLFDYANKQQME